MNTRIVGLVAAMLLAGPLTAHATMVSWKFGGVLTEVSGTAEEIAGLTTGKRFSVVVNFDTDTPISNRMGCADGGVGRRCNFFGSPAQFFTDLKLDSLFFPEFYTEPAFASISVRNNAIAAGDAPRFNGFTVGTGLILGPMLLDVAYVREFGGSTVASTAAGNPGLDVPPTMTPTTVRSTLTTNRFFASVIYRFARGWRP